jgi:hypothetical protein
MVNEAAGRVDGEGPIEGPPLPAVEDDAEFPTRELGDGGPVTTDDAGR